jgi:hypothetical protein
MSFNNDVPLMYNSALLGLITHSTRPQLDNTETRVNEALEATDNNSSDHGLGYWKLPLQGVNVSLPRPEPLATPKVKVLKEIPTEFRQEPPVPVDDDLQYNLDLPLSAEDANTWVVQGNGWVSIEYLKMQRRERESQNNTNKPISQSQDPILAVGRNSQNNQYAFKLFADDKPNIERLAGPGNLSQNKLGASSTIRPVVGPREKTLPALALGKPSSVSSLGLRENNPLAVQSPKVDSSPTRASSHVVNVPMGSATANRASVSSTKTLTAEHILGEKDPNLDHNNPDMKKSMYSRVFRVMNILRAIVTCVYASKVAYDAYTNPKVKTLQAQGLYIAIMFFAVAELILTIVKAYPKNLWFCWDVRNANVTQFNQSFKQQATFGVSSLITIF